MIAAALLGLAPRGAPSWVQPRADHSAGHRRLVHPHITGGSAAERPGPAQRAPVAEPPQDEPSPVGVAWRGWVWLLLIVLIVGALVVQALR